MFGVAIFLGFLLLAVQVLLHLYTVSIVTSAAYEAARLHAGSAEVPRAHAQGRAVQLLGAYGERVEFDWSRTDADQVVLRVTGPTPARMLNAVGSLAGLDVIDREVRVRVERPRGDP